MEKELPIDVPPLRKGSLVLRALKNKRRQKILSTIHQNQRMTVTEIYLALREQQSVVSQQLAILRREGFVNAQREGKRVYYSITYRKISSVQETIALFLKG